MPDLPGRAATFVGFYGRSCRFSPVFVHNSRHINRRGMNDRIGTGRLRSVPAPDNDQPIFERNDSA